MRLLSTALVIAAFANLTNQQVSYDRTFATQALMYSSAAYCAYETVDNWSCGLPCRTNSGFTRLRRFNNVDRNTFAFTGYSSNQNRIVLSFRGTNGADLQNWMTNLNGLKSDFPGVSGAQAHRGFLNAYNAIAGNIRTELRSLISSFRTAEILVTGHSLGGALANLAAADIRVNIRPSNRVRVMTFGQPRPGDDNFSNWLFQQFTNVNDLIRVTHADDPVVRLPPRMMGFRHAG